MMASSTYKRYHIHGYDSRQLLEDYFSGHIKGDVLIDLSISSLVHHLHATCEFFKHIIVLKVSDRCILELKRWLDTRTGAFDWGHSIKLHGEIAGKSDELQDKDGKVRSAAQHVVICDLEKDNMTDPIILPPADCIISAWLLEEISKDHDDFIKYLRKFSKLLKPGGHIILFGCLDITFFTVGKDKYHALTYDEDFVRKALVGEGFVIDNCKVKKRRAVSDIIDYKAIIFVAAHKEK
ncbi:indolethylamine N-methyltransferase-like isoform X2 [Dendropsophus ebraccatus]|uniref:indolethylamine N-methyltransferase-like isoform X2 n=1 Tax=Dendropsophus ebraccatus TaxID=150705 RepID=UPI003831900B